MRLRILATFTALAAMPLLSMACVSNATTPPVGDDAGGLPPFGEDGAANEGGSSASDGGLRDGTLGSDGSSPVGDAAGGGDGTTSGSDGGGAGSDGSPGSDGGGTTGEDAGGDGAAPASGPVTVIVTTATGPEPGAQVVFQDATGNVVVTGTTGLTGSVTETVAAGSQVTAVLGTVASPNLVTIAAVEPGDVLTILDTSLPPPGTGVDLTVTSFPDGGPDASSFTAMVGSCRAIVTAPPAPFVLQPGCVAGGESPLLVLAEGTSGELGFAYEKGIADLVDAGLTDGALAPVSVAMTGSWETGTPATVTVANLPSVSQGLIAFGEISGGVLADQVDSLVVNEDGGVSTGAFVVHTGYPDFVQTEANASLSISDTSGCCPQSVVAMATRSDVASPALGFDFSQALPAIVSGGLDYDNLTQPTVSWSTAAPAPTSSGSVFFLRWSGTYDGGGQSGTWTVVSPPTTTIVQLPALPASLAPWVSPTSGGWDDPIITILGGSLLPTYATLRASSASASLPAASLVSGYNPAVALVPALPANGTLQVSALLQSAE